MLQMVKNRLKDQKGLTLIELLAVIVILGIIAAIAVPSILGLIDNSKKDAHVANAQQMISAAKMAIASEADLQTGTDILSLRQLEQKNYLDPVDSPDNNNYAKGTNDTEYTTSDISDEISHVKIENGQITKINLVTTDGTKIVRGITEIATGGATTISSSDLDRKMVKDK